MSRQYIASASVSAAGAVTEIGSTSGAVATMLQVGTPATTGIKILGWGISFDGVTATDAPGVCYLIDCDVGMSAAASLTPAGFNKLGKDVASLCVGGTGATCVHDGTVTEGTITASNIIDMQEVHPQSGYGVWFPAHALPEVAVSRFVRVRVNFAVAVNCLPWIVFQE